MPRAEQPTGTVTMVFSDIEGSTRLLHRLGTERYAERLSHHRTLMRKAFARHGGYEVDNEGDAFFVTFSSAADALAAAAEAQRLLADAPWAPEEAIRVRMGVHTGEPLAVPPKYVGLDVHQAARIMAAGHGGQVLVSERTAALVRRRDDLRLVDLGLHRLKDLGEPVKLFQLGEAAFPPLKTLDATNLPAQASPLIGRTRELEEVEALVRSGARLVTITGPGGSGKTRFALQVAAELAGDFVDGVFLVPLQAVSEPTLLVPTIASTLGAQGDVFEHVGDKRMLLLLDNIEQLLPLAATALAELVSACPNVVLLVTSRAPVRISGERDYQLEPLTLADAIELFRARASAAEPESAVVEICLRLDCLPLALELAAARTRVLPPARLLDRLERALPVLTGGTRDAPARQQTLQATIDWSYDLLRPDAQRLFAELSVFNGTFSLESAEEVCDADLDSVAALVELSLVKATPGGRFVLLETIREYAARRLDESGEAARLRNRHAEHYLALAVETGGTMTSAARDRLSADVPNLRAALAHVAAADPDRALRTAVDLAPFWNARAPFEGRAVLATAYRPDLDHSLRLDALAAIAFFALQAGDAEDARRRSEEQLALARDVGDARATSNALLTLARIARHTGSSAEANRLGAEAVDTLRALGDDQRLARALMSLGADEALDGDANRALELLDQALGVLASEHDIAWVHLYLGGVHCRLRRWDEARAALARALAYFGAVGEMKAIANCLDHLAAVAGATGAHALSARLLGAGDAAWSSMDVPLEAAFRPRWIDDGISAARAALGDAAFDAERVAGAAATADEALREALSPVDSR